ncbi:MAG: hypothetical protein JXB88_15135 [Spirochaetales bacterium]|nr:hypothetical protein [Spirochaetales bacterium]
MARTLTFVLENKEYSLSPAKLNRQKLYGWKDIVPYDQNNEECQVYSIDESGTFIIPKGGSSLGMIDNQGKWVDKNELTAVDTNGNPVDIVPSSFSHPIALEQITAIEDFLDHSITSIYSLEGEHPAFADAIKKAKGLYTFIFNWRDDYEGDPAFIIESDGKLYVLVGKKNEIDFLSLPQTGAIEEIEDEEGEEEIDFMNL